PLVGGLVEDPRLRPELTAPDRGTERARRRVVTALSGLWLYEEHRVSSGWSPDAPDLMPALLPAAGCVLERACPVGILHKSAPVKKGSRCLVRNRMICNELHYGW